ncbi:MAG: Ig-like domain-containing protein [Clostridia bacterium]|nr:Ig-like domain-containing protein [Clostridia bacterium]
MKRIISFLLILSLSFLACIACAEEPGASNTPLTLYPAYLQTPLDMPIVLDAETYPVGQRLVWSSSVPSVATVDAEGCVTPFSPGETVITCALADQPSVTATCGVLVVAEGKILLWEYPPELMDLDAVIAEMEAEYAANPPEVPWPDAWPGDLPKMEGVVKSAGGGLTEENGLYVMLTVQEPDIVKAYVDELLSLGFNGKPMEYDGGFFAQLSGNGYTEVMVSYTESEQQCFISVKK